MSPAPGSAKRLPSINLRLTTATHQLLAEAARAEGISLSQYIRDAAFARAIIEDEGRGGSLRPRLLEALAELEKR